MEAQPKQAPACLCMRRSTPRKEPLVYPELKEGEDAAQLLQKYGYFVVRGLLTKEEIKSTITEISDIVSEWWKRFENTDGSEGEDWEEIANREPFIKNGEKQVPENKELAIRRLFRMAVHREYFAKLCRHPKIVGIIKQLLGEDLKLVQSMSLLKPPGGDQKKWHQDNAYFRLVPCKLAGCWIALDHTDCANGCMHLLPASHGNGYFKHAAPENNHIDYHMVDLPNPNDVLPVIMNPGDALIFHGETAHYTPPNVSDTRRRSVQFHYASSHCKPTKCPFKEQQQAPTPRESDKPHYFDCDPDCQEPEYWYYRKAELLVCGKEMGRDYI